MSTMGLKALPWVLRGMVAVAAAAIALLGSARPALAAEHGIGLRVLAHPEVNQPLSIDVYGTVAPPAEFWDQSWIEVVALPGSFGQCPGDAQSGGAMAEQAGVILAIALHPNADEAGHFVNAVAFTPHAVGPILFCGYLYNEVGETWAAAEVKPEVVGSSGPPSGEQPGSSSNLPVNQTRPWVTRRRHRLICHPGSWSNANGSYAYNWLIDGQMTRVTGRRTQTGPEDRGHRVTCRVTAYGPGGSSWVMSRVLRLR